MKSFAKLISHHPAMVLILASVLAGVAVLGALKTTINYDIFSYVPKDVESIKGQAIMAHAFNAADTTFVLLNTTDTAEILNLKQDLEKINGIEAVSWISDLLDPSVPDFLIPNALLSLYKNGNYALLHITYTGSATSVQTQNAVREIKNHIGSNKPFTGLPVFLYELRDLVRDQKVKSILTAVVLSMAVTALATGSIMTPFLFLITIGAGVLFNMGTNCFMGSISYITEALSAVIQLGVTIDFSILLMHRYQEELRGSESPAQAMQKALEKTMVALIPCALVTMTGFLALVFMKITIGFDMGFVMAKGVFFGFLCTMTILPALTLIVGRFITMGQAKKAPANLRGLAAMIIRYPLVITIIMVLLLVPSFYIRQHANLSYSLQDILPQNLASLRALPEIEAAMGPIELVNILFPKTTPRYVQAQALDVIEKLPGVVRVLSLDRLVDPAVPQDFVPDLLRQRFTQENYTLAVARITFPMGSDDGNALVGDIRRILDENGIHNTYVAGNSAISKDLTDLSAADLETIDFAALIGICLIITLFFTSATIPFILVAGIMLAIFINVSIPYLLGNRIPYITFSTITAIQLGTCVNYAIFLMSRYREERRRNDPIPSMINSLSGTIPTIFTSAMCLFCATIGLVFISDVSMVQSLALMIGRGALLGAGVIIFLVPGVILLTDKLICLTSFGWKKTRMKEYNNDQNNCDDNHDRGLEYAAVRPDLGS